MMIHLDKMLSDKAIITPASNVFLSINIKVCGKNFSKILGVAGFEIEIIVICVLNVSLRKKANPCFTGGVIKLSTGLLQPHVLETKRHQLKESCSLSYSLVNLIILKQPSEPCLELVDAVMIIIIFYFLKRALTSHETRH